MAETSEINWLHRHHPITGTLHKGGTVNFWIGCTPCDAACDLCYADAADAFRYQYTLSPDPARAGHKGTPQRHFGPGAPRWRTKAALTNARNIERAARKAGIPLPAFTNSLADFFDTEVPDEWRDEAMEVIYNHQSIDWMILTKRAHKMREYITRSQWWMNGGDWADQNPQIGPNWIWLGVTAATVAGVKKRLPDLVATPAAYRFVSCEPLLEDIAAELEPFLLRGQIDLVIVGGESEQPHNPRAKAPRPMNPDHVERIREACWAHAVPFHFKQWGAWAPAYELDHNPQAQAMCVMERVPRHEFPENSGGRRFVYRVGTEVSGHTFNGKIFAELPRLRSLDV